MAKPGSRASIDAQIAGEEIARIREEKGGDFKNECLVEAARPKSSPLHDHFEWNDRIAAHAYRVEQAGYLVRHVVKIDMADPDAEPVRAFVSVRNDEGEHVYTSIEAAMSVPERREQLLEQALADLRAFERKYNTLLDLAATMTAFKRAVERAKIRAKVRPAADGHAAA